MTRDNFVLMAATLQTAYPWANLFPNDKAMDIWYAKLADVPDELATVVVDKWIETSGKPPAISDIRRETSTIVNGTLPTWEDGWKQVRRAIGRYGYMAEKEALASLDGLTRSTVESLGWQQICESENQDVLRANFRMVYEIMANRKKESSYLSEPTRKAIANIQHNSAANRRLLDPSPASFKDVLYDRKE